VITLIIVLAVLAVALVGFVGFFVSKSRSAGESEPVEAPAPSAPTTPSTKPESPPSQQAPSIEPSLAEEEVPSVEEPHVEAVEYKERLGRSRGIFGALRALRGSKKIDATALDELEAALLSADVGVATTDHLLAKVRQEVAANPEEDGDDLLALLRRLLLELLELDGEGAAIDRSLLDVAEPGRVPVWLFVGVNGVGKTTTIGKIATKEAGEGKKVVLAAGDTFRAAAGDQLAIWAERSGADVVRGAEGGDPSAVVFDAIQRGGARGYDLVLADTAGRLQNKVNLIEELKKIRRVADKEPGHVTEVLLVLDATTGQNAVSQAREFLEAVEVTGVALTKLDGTARGGIVLAIQRELGIPVKLVGLGEGPGDLVAFDPVEFVDALLAP
jgi:fused signal recognition particle receptor